MKTAAFVGTFDGVNYRRNRNRSNIAPAPAWISGTVMACFVFVTIVWLGSL